MDGVKQVQAKICQFLLLSTVPFVSYSEAYIVVSSVCNVICVHMHSYVHLCMHMVF